MATQAEVIERFTKWADDLHIECDRGHIQVIKLFARLFTEASDEPEEVQEAPTASQMACTKTPSGWCYTHRVWNCGDAEPLPEWLLDGKVRNLARSDSS